MNKEQVLDLVDRLADKSLSFGCEMTNSFQLDGNPFKTKILQQVTKKSYTCIEIDGSISEFPKDALSIIGHPIRIGDVLEKLASKYDGLASEIKNSDIVSKQKFINEFDHKMFDTLNLWLKASGGAISKSLQEIIEASGWEEIYDGEGGQMHLESTVLKSPEATKLFNFLIQIFND